MLSLFQWRRQSRRRLTTSVCKIAEISAWHLRWKQFEFETGVNEAEKWWNQDPEDFPFSTSLTTVRCVANMYHSSRKNIIQWRFHVLCVLWSLNEWMKEIEKLSHSLRLMMKNYRLTRNFTTEHLSTFLLILFFCSILIVCCAGNLQMNEWKTFYPQWKLASEKWNW